MQEAKTKLFETVPVPKAVLTLAVPTVISQLITVLYNMADTFFVGQLGDPELVAAATIAMPLFILLTGIANLFGMGGASLISRCLGVKNDAKAHRASVFCVYAGLCTAAVYGLAVFAFRPVLLPLLGATAADYDLTYQYLFWTVTVGGVPTVFNSLMSHLVRAEGASRQASIGVIFGGLLNIALDPLFLFAFHLGLKGAAIATMLSNLAAAIYFLLYLYRHRKTTVLRLSPRFFSLGDHIPGEVVAVGLPSFMISAMAMLSNAALNHIIAGQNDFAVAGMGIAKKINTTAFAVAQGITQGTLPLIGYNFSAGNRVRLRSVVRFTAVFSVLLSLVLLAAVQLLTGRIVGCFISDAVTVNYGKKFLHIISLAYPTTAVTFMAITLFQATGRKGAPLLLSMLRKGCVDIPLMFLFHSLIGVTGVAWATPAADTLAMAISLCVALPYFHRQIQQDSSGQFVENGNAAFSRSSSSS